MEVTEPPKGVSDEAVALVEAAKAGDRRAAERLVTLFRADVFRMIYYRVYSGHDADDLTQDVFLSMMNGLGGLRETDRFRSWLFRIALNKVRDFKRKERFFSFFGLSHDDAELEHPDGGAGDPGRMIEGKQFIGAFRRFTGALPEGEREVFTLRFVDRLGIAEIAGALGKGESTVKTHLYRALKKFKDDEAFRQSMGKGAGP